MSHLSIDRLAAIADDTPTPDEATHLAGCWDCRAEVAAYRRLARMSAMAPLPTEPLTAWSRLAPQLRAEGLITDAAGAAGGAAAGGAGGGAGGAGGGRRDAGVVPLFSRRPILQSWAVRAAAGLALVLGGALVGRLSTGVPFGTAGGDLLAGASPVPAAFASSDEALEVLTVAQQRYQSAAAFLASQDTSARFIGMNQDSYRARLAALDEIAATARAALYRAPQDPMLNQYYLTTLGAREATLREIGASLPETRRLERY
ncbi:MAG: hypothetical protein WD771_05225 [Gemmatimonadaceae bacterium]